MLPRASSKSSQDATVSWRRSAVTDLLAAGAASAPGVGSTPEPASSEGLDICRRKLHPCSALTHSGLSAETRRESEMRRIVLIGLTTILLLAVIAARANTSRSSVQAEIRPARIDTFSLMANAKNLPSQETLN